MTALLLGADGQVGHALRETLNHHAPLVASTREGRGNDIACDLADAQAVVAMLDHIRPRLIVNAAAFTAVDKAESEAASAIALNTELPGCLGAWARTHAARVVHYSTDYVFDGHADRPYREDDPTSPQGVYGRSKRDGEDALRTTGCDHLILRTAWVYGQRGHNFLLTMLKLAAERGALRVVADQYGTPTSAPWIAAATATVLEQWADGSTGGTFHLTAAGQSTWYGFAREIIDGALARGIIRHAPAINPIPTSEYPTPAARPAYSVLDGSRIDGRFGLSRPAWTSLVHDVLDRIATSLPSAGAPSC